MIRYSKAISSDLNLNSLGVESFLRSLDQIKVTRNFEEEKED